MINKTISKKLLLPLVLFIIILLVPSVSAPGCQTNTNLCGDDAFLVTACDPPISKTCGSSSKCDPWQDQTWKWDFNCGWPKGITCCQTNLGLPECPWCSSGEPKCQSDCNDYCCTDYGKELCGGNCNNYVGFTVYCEGTNKNVIECGPGIVSGMWIDSSDIAGSCSGTLPTGVPGFVHIADYPNSNNPDCQIFTCVQPWKYIPGVGCVDTSTNENYCGYDPTVACASGEECCPDENGDGSCVLLESNPDNCGECGNVCSEDTPICMGGSCNSENTCGEVCCGLWCACYGTDDLWKEGYCSGHNCWGFGGPHFRTTHPCCNYYCSDPTGGDADFGYNSTTIDTTTAYYDSSTYDNACQCGICKEAYPNYCGLYGVNEAGCVNTKYHPDACGNCHTDSGYDPSNAWRCCNSIVVNTDTDERHCGGCVEPIGADKTAHDAYYGANYGVACSPGQVCLEGECWDVFPMWLKKGLNFIALPVNLTDVPDDPSVIKTPEDLCNIGKPSGSDWAIEYIATKIRYTSREGYPVDPSSQEYSQYSIYSCAGSQFGESSYFSTSPDRNHEFEFGEGLIVYSNKDVYVEWVGNYSSNQTLQLDPGYNLIGWSVDHNQFTQDALAGVPYEYIKGVISSNPPCCANYSACPLSGDLTGDDGGGGGGPPSGGGSHG